MENFLIFALFNYNFLAYKVLLYDILINSSLFDLFIFILYLLKTNPFFEIQKLILLIRINNHMTRMRNILLILYLLVVFHANAQDRKALPFYRDKPPTHITGFIYNGLAAVHLQKNSLDSAKKYLDLAQKISDNSKYLLLKNSVLATSKRYYSEINNIEKLKEVIQKEDTVENKIQARTTSFLDQSYVSMNTKIKNAEEKVEKTEQESSAKTYLIVIAATILLSGIVYFAIYKRKQQRNIEHFRQTINRSQTGSRNLQHQEPGFQLRLWLKHF